MLTVRPEAADDHRTAPPSLWRNRSFNLLWGSQTLSDVGSGMSSLAVPLLVLAMTGSPVTAGVVGTVAAVVRAATRLPAGVLVDRVDRRRTMLACDGVRLVALAGLGALILTGHATLASVIAVTVVEAVANVVFGTAEASALRNLVPASQMTTAVARNEARSAAAGLVGPPLGGLFYGIARSVPFLADALSYLLSFVGVALIREPMQQERTVPTAGAMADMSEGVRFVLRQPFIRTCLMIAAPINFGFNGLLFAIVLLLRQQGTAPALIGTVETIVGVGALLGAVCAPAIGRLFGIRTLLLAICWAGTALVAAGALLTGSILVAVPVAVAIFLGPAANAVLFATQAAVTPDRLQGRVVSIVFLAAMSLATVAPVAAGLLVDNLGGPGTVLVFAGVLSIAALAATFSKGMRQVPTLDAPPAAAATAVTGEPGDASAADR